MFTVRRLLFVSLLAGMLVLASCSTIASKPHPTARVQPTTPPTPLPTPTPVAARPVHLTIPALGVDAPIEEVGTMSNGDMETPTQNPWTGVGWLRSGTHPGEVGSAVIDGHLDRPGGAPAIFWNLHNLQPGDLVKVTDENGKTLQFHVLRVAAYPRDQAPLQEIFGNSGGTFLNLITCAGTWVPSQQQLTLRLVVYTSL